MKIAFHSNQLGLRGTEVALFDYAHFNETLLGNESIIVTPRSSGNHHPDAAARFGARFKIFAYDDRQQLDSFIAQNGVDVFYMIKAGNNDGLAPAACRSAVHAVFEFLEPHGTVYAYVSKWLAEKMSGGALPHVPHMIHLPRADRDLRDELGIPRGAMVFARFGGHETFDIPFARQAVEQCAREMPGVFFLFMNTDRFCEDLPNIIHLPATSDPMQKARFIATSDAMLHARQRGETFGLAIGEFSIMNKPVLTWDGSPERCHLEILGDKAIRYSDAAGLSRLLREFRPDKATNYDLYSRDYSPQAVMEKFKQVFL